VPLKKPERGRYCPDNQGIEMKNGTNIEKRAMRDVFIEQIYNRMHEDDNLFFLSADFGSPRLDRLKEEFKDRFINVGIAEQNLINIAAGLALEGFTVYAYAIAPFLTMRAFEQIRNNLSLLSRIKEINVNLVGVGAGLSYDVSGPTHHCLEDISIMRTLPNISVFSPSDWVLAEKFVDYSIKVKKPKYIRFDSKPLPNIYDRGEKIYLQRGFCELAKGNKVCLVTTGYMTHTAMNVVNKLTDNGIKIGLIDVFLLEPFNEKLFLKAVSKYKNLITIEEGFINRGGLDSLVFSTIGSARSKLSLKRMGFKNAYVFEMGGRAHLHKLKRLDDESIIKNIKDLLRP
jgi:transketolase